MNAESLGKDSLQAGNNTPPKAKGFFYGWIVVAVLTLAMTTIYGAQFSFSVFLKPLSEWFGWSRAMTSGALATSLWVTGLLGVLMGILTDKYGPRLVMVVGGFLGCFGYLIISNANALWHMYVGFGILIATSTSTIWTPVTATVSRWFTEKRVLALGIATAGIGLGRMTIPPLMAYLIEEYDWRTAYAVLAVMVGVIVVSSAIPARRSPQDMGLLPDGETGRVSITAGKGKGTEVIETKEWSSREAVRTLAFWLLLATNVAIAGIFYMVGIHIVAYATDVGIGATTAASILIFMGGANILSKVVVGGVATKIGSRLTLLFCLLLKAIALLFFTVIGDFWMFCAAAAVFGFAFGGTAPLHASLIAEFFGVKSVGVIMGLAGVGWAAGCALGTVVGDYIFDVSGSYVMAFLVTGVVAMAAGVLMLLLRPPTKHRKSPREAEMLAL